MTRKLILIAFVGLTCYLTACKKDPLKGIDKKALFAQPTATELAAIQSEWNKRNLTPTEPNVEQTYTINDKLELKIVSFRLYGFKQYAGVLLPKSDRPLPVQIYMSGFGLEEPYAMQNIQLSTSGTLPFIYVLPALRGQSIKFTVNETTYTSPVSEGIRNDAFDGAADDGLAALNATGILFSQADVSSVLVRGGSRGATVVLLMAERDQRIKRVASVAGPTDLLTATTSHQSDPTYRFQFLDELISGKVSLEQARKKLIASSPLYFCASLPKTQMHLGEKDEIVPTSHGTAMQQAMQSAGKQDKFELFIYAGRTHSNIGTGNTEMDQRIKTFFQVLLP